MLSQAKLELEWYSDAITKAYMQMRHRYRPELVYMSNRDKKMVDGLAERLWHCKINPYNYVRFVFDLYARQTGDVFFPMVASPKSVQAYIEERPIDEDNIKRLVQLQYQLVETEKSYGRTLRDILTDYHLQLSAVFRYAVAWTVGEEDLCELFRKDAERMILFEPLYQELLKNALPEELNCGQSNANRT
jgi:hypothetical protein